MARFTVKIETDGAAFGEEPELQVAAILRDVADMVEAGGLRGGKVRDWDGNTCGWVRTEGD